MEKIFYGKLQSVFTANTLPWWRSLIDITLLDTWHGFGEAS